MDKETLSNYGWIVICVLVLAVMLALAGPFGTFVADAVKSTTAGLFGVNQNALGAAGITIEDQAFTNGPSITFNQELSTDSNNPTKATGTSFTLSGTVSSDKGIKSLTVNGSEITVNADGTWTTTITLTKNEVKEVTVIATDNEENTASNTGYVAYIEWVNIDNFGVSHLADAGYTITSNEIIIPSTFKRADGVWCKVVGIGNLIDATMSSVTIPNTVTIIYTAAFKGCTNLTKITYEGTMAEWNAVELRGAWNGYGEYIVPATEVICSDGTVSLS